jgi:hypothetical protein
VGSKRREVGQEGGREGGREGGNAGGSRPVQFGGEAPVREEGPDDEHGNGNEAAA